MFLFEIFVGSMKHYRKGSIQAIHAIQDWDLNFNLGNVVKYIQRYRLKNGDEDLLKAVWYLLYEVTKDTDYADKQVYALMSIMKGEKGDTQSRS